MIFTSCFRLNEHCMGINLFCKCDFTRNQGACGFSRSFKVSLEKLGITFPFLSF